VLSATPLLPVAGALAAGLVLAAWSLAPGIWLVGAGGSLLVAAAVALLLHRERVATGLVLAAVVAAGLARGAALAPGPEHLASMALRSPATVEGVLVEEPVRWAVDRTRLLLDADTLVDGASRRPVIGRIQLTVYGETVALTEGQRVGVTARVSPPIGFRNPGGFDYPAHLRREGILLVGSGRGDRVWPLTPEEPPWPVRLKRWAVATIGAELPEGAAALLAGLVLGERTGLPRETDDGFRRAGVYHVLAVSGFNVALLASSVFFTLSMVGVPRRLTAAVAGLVLVGFALVVGGQPSVLRATAMGLLLLLSVLLDRESQIMNALALATIAVLVWRPGDIWEPGFLLSFGATAGIIHLAAPTGAALQRGRCPRWLAQALGVSLGAQVGVTPIMLAHFNQLSLIGVLANLIVVPISAAATTLGLLALALSALNDLAASFLWNFLWALLVLLRAVVWAAAAVPFAMVHLPAPGAPETVAWYAAAALAPLMAARRWTQPVVAGLSTVALVLSVWPWVRPGDGMLRVTFLDVGQGDAALVELPEGPRLLIDGGAAGPRRFDVGERIVAPFLWNRPTGRLDVVALSHSDPDHSGGLAAVLRRFRVGEFWENGRWGPGSEDTLRAVSLARVPRRVLTAGEHAWLGTALITVLNSGGGSADGAERGPPPSSENDGSLVLRIEWRGVVLLMTGDVGWRAEQALLDSGLPLRTSVLKVAHHGSRFGTTAGFLAAAGPRFAVISVGARNPFRHPTPEALSRLAAAGARVYRTDRDGAVIVETDGAILRMTCWASGVTETFDLDPPIRSRPSDSPTPLVLPGA
jgi:competence protein ComEC